MRHYKGVTDAQLDAAAAHASKLGLRSAEAVHHISAYTILAWMKLKKIPRLPVGHPVMHSPEEKRRAIRIAKRKGILAAASETGICPKYVQCLVGPRCRVHGFEGRRYIKELAEVDLKPGAPTPVAEDWVKARAA